MSDHKPRGSAGAAHGSGADALLGDLENLRSLLNEEQAALAAAAPEEPADDDVPLLQDVVAEPGDAAATPRHYGAPGLDERMFSALLSEKWRDAARQLVDEARARVERQHETWTPAHTDDLNAALRERIDATVNRWLRDLVESRIDELREELLAVLKDEITRTVATAAHGDTSSEDPDGE